MSFGGGATAGEERAEMSGANRFTRKAAVDRSHPQYGLDYTLKRRDLTTSQAADIAFNPASKYGTSGEKALAGAQIVIPGGTLLGGIRTLQMTQKVGAKAAADDSQRDDDNAPAVAAPKKQKSVVATGVKRTAAASPQKRVTPKKSVTVASAPEPQATGTSKKGMMAAIKTTPYGILGEAPVTKRTLKGSLGA